MTLKIFPRDVLDCLSREGSDVPVDVTVEPEQREMSTGVGAIR